MKSSKIISVFSTIVATLIIAFALVILSQNARFTLSNEYYGTSGIEEITISELSDLIAQKKTFGLFVSQPNCIAADDFSKILSQFTRQHSLKVFEVPFSELRSSGLASEVRFYPSFIIYRNGEIVDFLDANDTDDTKAYTTLDGFQNWFTQQVQLRE